MKFRSQNNNRFKPYSQSLYETQNKGTLRFIILAAVCLALISVFWLAPVKKLVLHVSSILWGGEERVGNGLAMVTSPLGLFEVRKENAELREKVFQSEIDAIEYKALRQENAELKSSLLLDYGTSSNDVTYAAVTATKHQSSQDLLVINKGTESGINIGDLAIYGGAIPVGVVLETYKNSSIILLYSSFDTLTSIVIGSTTQAEARGKGLGSFEIKVPKGSNVNEGDLIRVRGTAARYALGTVGAVESVESNPFQIAYFTYPVQPQNMSYVAVIKKHE